MKCAEWPTVVDEFTTLDKILGGRSIARLGDGEFKIIFGANCVSQIQNKELGEELKHVLQTPSGVMVGIPTMNHEGAEYSHNWRRYEKGYLQLLSPEVEYHSAFITRPDSAQWIDVPEYWEKITDIWRNKRVTLVRGSVRSLTPERIPQAAEIHDIICQRRDAYADIDHIEQQVLNHKSDITILCLGPTATCLAYRLEKRGVHAVDLGHVGMFLKHKGRYRDLRPREII